MSIKDRKISTPFVDELPPLSTSEFTALRLRIETEGGIHDPVLITEDNEILDGHNRRKIDPDAPMKIIPGSGQWSDAEKRAFVIRCNRGRRNLSHEQGRQVETRSRQLAKQLKAEGKTQQQIAEKLGVSQPRVSQWIGNGTGYKGTYNVSAPIDCRVKVDRRHYAAIAERANGGESIRTLAADWKVEPKTIKRIVKKESQQYTAREAVANYQRKLCHDLGQFALIYADPPWRFEFQSTECREIEKHYPTMAFDELFALPVPEITLETSILMMWAPNAKVAEAILLAERWGFVYRTNMVWVKNKIGMGFYARNRHEMLLIFCKGKMPSPEPSNRPNSVIEAPRGEHSVKPRIAYDLIDQMYPQFVGKEYRIELFRRGADEDLDKTWTTWGNEAPTQSVKTTAQDGRQRPQRPSSDI